MRRGHNANETYSCEKQQIFALFFLAVVGLRAVATGLVAAVYVHVELLNKISNHICGFNQRKIPFSIWHIF